MLKRVLKDKTGRLVHSNEFLQLCQTAQAQVQEISQQACQAQCQADPHLPLIDVRDSEELHSQGYIPNAYHLSKGWIEADIHHLVADKSQTLILYCGSGKRSLLAALQLKKMGYVNVLSLTGGFKAWKEAGLSVEYPE